MTVIDHEPHAYFLLRDGKHLYLDANCSHGPLGYSVLIRLNEAEASRHVAEGRAYVRELAAGIHDAVPIANPGSAYAVRDIRSDSAAGRRAGAAIAAWLG